MTHATRHDVFPKRWEISYLTLNRPTVLNAMNYQGALDLNRAAECIRDDPHVRLVLIRGAGRAFCTGLDLEQLAAGEIPHDYYELWDRALRILEQAEFEENLRRQRIALASPDHQEAVAAYRDGREPVFSA